MEKIKLSMEMKLKRIRMKNENNFYINSHSDLIFGGVSKKDIIKIYNFRSDDFLPYEPLKDLKKS